MIYVINVCILTIFSDWKVDEGVGQPGTESAPRLGEMEELEEEELGVLPSGSFQDRSATIRCLQYKGYMVVLCFSHIVT